MNDTNVVKLSDREQKRAAYALNMCAVSVSQIIDYNDINILEQEYDAILNNINLEEMPKDDALLNILTDLLDVITHFKISEMEKQLIDREYQQKMKNAIWAAVPNFGVILAGGSPLTMAISLANQVGIGYMNYRRNKEEYGLEKDRQQWQLKRAAIEQFNFIRKELFNCAWRLADTYNFPDAYRLTEKQIKQYNLILQDQDIRRKYERLEAVKDKFEAYPPFWYFIGNAANLIANDTSLDLSESSRSSFRARALAYFEKFEDIEQNSILKEDVLSASCALEHIDLLLLEASVDKDKINALLNKAVRMSGNAFDMLQLCAITYLKIGNTEGAIRILRNLVNEDYNKIINAQLLSAIYVHSIDLYKADYELLATRVDAKYLFPMPEANRDVKLLEAKFEARRKENVKRELESLLNHVVQKYTVRWNAVLSTFEEDKQYPDDFFYDNETAKMRRREEAERVLGNDKLAKGYQKHLANCNFALMMQRILNDMTESLFSLWVFSESHIQNKIEEEIRDEIKAQREAFDKIQKAISAKAFQMSDYVYSQNLTLGNFVSPGLHSLKQYGNDSIDSSDMSSIALMESDFVAFCERERIEVSEVMAEESAKESTVHPHTRFGRELFGRQTHAEKKNEEFLDKMSQFVRDRIKEVPISGGQIEILLRNDLQFEGYFRDDIFKNNNAIEAHAVMVIHDKSHRTPDLIFTTDGIMHVDKGTVSKYLTPYDEVKLKNGKLALYDIKYKHKSIDIFALEDMIHQLGMKYAKNLDKYVEYIPGAITIKILLDWFKHNKEAQRLDVKRVIVIPDKENLEHFGFGVRSGLDTDENLMQCYYDMETGVVLGMRIVRGEGIDSKLQSLLLENNKMLFVGR